MADKNGLKDAIYQAVIMQAEGKAAESEAALRRVLAEAPNEPDALHFLGLAEYRKGRNNEAVRLIRRAVAVDRDNPLYLESLGKILMAQGRLPEAEAAFRGALRLSPKRADLHFQLAETLRPRGKNVEAEAAYRRALALDPKLVGAGNGLGIVLEEQGRIDEAEAVYRRTLKIAGEVPDVLFNLGNVLRDQHRTADAAEACRRAIAVKPDFAEAHVHLAYALLMQGNYKPAWAEYEWRWRVPAFAGTRRDYPVPTWDGRPLQGRTLLLWTEQGFGDTLQFARYAGIAAGMGGRVILDCQPALVRLMSSAAGVWKAIARGDEPPKFDVHAPLLSLPGLLGTTLRTVPRNVPYLAAEPEMVESWRKRLAGTPGLKVGIAWRGTAERRGNPARACPLAAFAPLLEDRRLRLFSLQKELAAEDRPLPKGLTNLSHELKDFADTAAIVAALDAVVTIDTAVAHLAGGLGRPTLVMVSTACDWRWRTEGNTTPWYPNARIIRQARPGDWG
ncbi:MAG: tetratricopeptide repeat protein, partial [Rhodospirillales bacterium]